MATLKAYAITHVIAGAVAGAMLYLRSTSSTTKHVFYGSSGLLKINFSIQ